MKSSFRPYHPATLLLLCTLGVVMLSWICEVYGWSVVDSDTGLETDIQSLLSAEGIRWMLKHVTDNFTAYPPLGPVLVTLFGVGPAFHSGWVDACLRRLHPSRALSRKERRSLWPPLLLLACYVSLILLGAFSSWGILRGIDGSLSRSPLASGLLFLSALGIALAGTVYGFSVGRYRTDRDVVDGLIHFIRPVGLYLVLAFFASQLLACLFYSRLDLLFRVGGVDFLTPCIVHLPWIWVLCRR